MILNVIVIVVFLSILIERYLNIGIHKSFHVLLHSLIIFATLYLTFYLISKNEDSEMFEKNVLNKQLNKVTEELRDNTSIVKTQSFVPKNDNDKTSLFTLENVLIINSLMIIGFLLFYYINRRYKFITFEHLMHSISHITLLFIVEFIFDFLIKKQSHKSKKENTLSKLFLENILEHSNFVP